MDPPKLRKKHQANEKSKEKGTMYSKKHIRIKEMMSYISNKNDTN